MSPGFQASVLLLGGWFFCPPSDLQASSFDTISGKMQHILPRKPGLCGPGARTLVPGPRCWEALLPSVSLRPPGSPCSSHPPPGTDASRSVRAARRWLRSAGLEASQADHSSSWAHACWGVSDSAPGTSACMLLPSLAAAWAKLTMLEEQGAHSIPGFPAQGPRARSPSAHDVSVPKPVLWAWSIQSLSKLSIE